MENLNPVWKFLNDSPVVLLVLGFALTTVVGGLLTKRWQSRAKEWELKTSLVTRMTDEVLNFLMDLQFAVIGAKSLTQEDFDAALKRWEIQQGVIGSTIRAYFPEANLAKAWDEFAEHMTDFYNFTGATNQNYRLKRLDKLKAYLGQNVANWEQLVDLESGRSGDLESRVRYQESWFAVKSAMSEKNGEIDRKVLKSKLVATH